MMRTRPIGWLVALGLTACPEVTVLPGGAPDVVAVPAPSEDPLPVDETGYLDADSLRMTAPGALPAEITLVGFDGFLEDGGALTVRNTTTGDDAWVARGEGGGLVATVWAEPGHEVELLQTTAELDLVGTYVVGDSIDPSLTPIPPRGPVTGPLWPEPDPDGIATMDTDQLGGIGVPFVAFNADGGDAIQISDLEGPISLPARSGDAICLFVVDEATGDTSPTLCDVVATAAR